MGIKETKLGFYFGITTIIVVVLLATILIFPIIFPGFDSQNQNEKNDNSLSFHIPISISSDFFLSRVAVYGSGTSFDPYILEGWQIFSNITNGIYITGTTKNFVIRNCLIDGCVIPPDICEYHGIFLEKITEGTATIINVTTKNCQMGIYLSNVTDCIIKNSTITSNNCKSGLYIENSKNITLLGNSFFGDGLVIDEYSSYSCSVSDNLVNGLPLGFFVNENTLTIDGNDIKYGQIRLTNCTNIEIKNQQCCNSSVGISMIRCSNSRITDSSFSYNHQGIFITYSNDISVINCFFSENTRNGIGYWFSKDLFAENCFFQGNYHAIYCWKVTGGTINDNYCSSEDSSIFLLESNSINIINNHCSQSKYGIYLDNTISSSIINNSCNNNRFDGIILYKGHSFTIANNTCTNNLGHGLGILSSNTSLITGNTFTENNYYGICITYESFNNTIYRNNFLNNSFEDPLDSQCCDYGINNIWYNQDTNEGNYWSDYSGSGYYIIGGTANAVDMYPLTEIV